MSQTSDNPFIHSSTNKRYYTFDYYVKQTFGKKAAKIPLNASFTCPNRDGTKGIGGCTFCSAKGSGDSVLEFDQPLLEQFQVNLERARKKWPEALAIAYFQSFSNTYAPLSVLQKIYQPFLDSPKVSALSIATRADCLDEEFLEWIAQFQKPVWIELGLQTIHEKTSRLINRKHSLEDVERAVKAIHRRGLKVCIHLMNGLPGEDPSMMIESARKVSAMKPDAVKIHMLHLLKNTKMAAEYQLRPFHLLSLQEYVSIVCSQLEVLDENIIIERLTGDGIAAELIGPDWTIRKTAVLNEIDKELYARNTWQGKYAKTGQTD